MKRITGYTDNTEVLTAKGYKLTKDIEYYDLLAFMNNNNEVRFEHAKCISAHSISGSVDILKSSHIELASIQKSNISDKWEKDYTDNGKYSVIDIPVSGYITPVDRDDKYELTDIERFTVLYDVYGFNMVNEKKSTVFMFEAPTGNIEGVGNVISKIGKFAITFKGDVFYAKVVTDGRIDIKNVDYSTTTTSQARALLEEYDKWVGLPHPENCAYIIASNKTLLNKMHILSSISGCRSELSHIVDAANRKVQMGIVEIGKDCWKDEKVKTTRVGYKGFLYCIDHEYPYFLGRQNKKPFIGKTS